MFDSIRREIYQEHINKRVLVEWVRITGLDNKAKWKLDRLLSYLSNTITGYTGTENVFTWPTFAVSGGIPAYRAKVSYAYWRYFMSEGRRRLAEHNKEQGTKIAVIKEQILRNQDSNNFGLLVRKKLYSLYASKKVKAPEISVKRGLLHIWKKYGD
ncbi:hypothetical protein COOONC_17545 [Cooperia oncophora]